MLEYFRDTTLQLLPKPDLQLWLGVSNPLDYLTLLRMSQILAYCPTTLAKPGYPQWLLDPDDRAVLNTEFGLPPSTAMIKLRQRLQSYLDEPWSIYSCKYQYNTQEFTLTGDLSARTLWMHLSRHRTRLLVTVDPVTLRLDCRG